MKARTLLAFTVPGIPVPQGSKTAFVAGNRAVMTDDNKVTLKPWRAAVTARAKDAAWKTLTPLVGGVVVDVEFRFVRPKSVKRATPSVRPDVDKLARAVLDGITDAHLWGDDSQVVVLHVTKVYAAQPGAYVRIGQLNGTEN